MRCPASRRAVLRCLGAAAAWPAAAVADKPVIDELRAGSARLELQFAEGFDAALRARARAWVQAAAAIISAYFGRFPVPEVELLMIPAPGAGVRGGTTFGEPSPYVRLR